jgi:hypothetical protein
VVVRKRLRRGSRCYGYATKTIIDLRRVYKDHRRMFRIETSHRLINQSRAKTSTRDAVKRLLLVAVSLLLANPWTHLKWIHTSHVRRGRHGRTVEEELLPYATLLLCSSTQPKINYGTIKAIPPNNRSPRQRRRFPNYRYLF